MVDFVVRRPARRAVMVAVAAALGLLAFAADAIDGFAARQVRPRTGSA